MISAMTRYAIMEIGKIINNILVNNEDIFNCFAIPPHTPKNIRSSVERVKPFICCSSPTKKVFNKVYYYITFSLKIIILDENLEELGLIFFHDIITELDRLH